MGVQSPVIQRIIEKPTGTYGIIRTSKKPYQMTRYRVSFSRISECSNNELGNSFLMKTRESLLESCHFLRLSVISVVEVLALFFFGMAWCTICLIWIQRYIAIEIGYFSQLRISLILAFFKMNAGTCDFPPPIHF